MELSSLSDEQIITRAARVIKRNNFDNDNTYSVNPMPVLYTTQLQDNVLIDMEYNSAS